MVYLRRNISRIILILTVVESIFVLSAILKSPSEVGNARLLGLSTSRLILFSSSLVVVLLSVGLLLFSLFRSQHFDVLESNLKSQVAKRPVFCILFAICLLGLYSGLQLALYAPFVDEPVASAFMTRLHPIFIWMAVLSLQFGVLFCLWQPDLKYLWQTSKKTSILTLVLFGFFLVIWLWIARTGYGFAEETRESGYFRVVGTPITGFQVFVALICAFGVSALWKYFRPIMGFSHRKELVIGLGLWLLTFALWMSTPLVPSWFADQPRLPNNSFSPNSDALLYDTIGQSMLVGSGYNHPIMWGDEIRRPMLAGMIAFFHAIRGPGYEEIIILQVALLAAYPAVVFLITRRLHNSISGLMAGLLIMMRERNSILLADDITVSHAKILMSDLPATLGVVLFLWIMIQWIEDPKTKANLPLIAGGVLGFFALMRVDIGLLMVFVGIAGLWLLRQKKRTWVSGMTTLTIGFILMVAPWALRNWQLTGTPYIDTPNNMRRFENIFEDFLFPLLDFEKSYSPEPETFPAYKRASLIHEAHEVSTVKVTSDEQFSQFENMLNHFFNGQTQYVYFLPLYPSSVAASANLITDRSLAGFWETCCSVEEYVRRLPIWWGEWQGDVPPVSYLSLGIVLFVLSVGVAVLWRQRGIIGVLTILAGGFHVLYFALNRRSGGRWLMEYDWFSVVILSVGLVAMAQGAVKWLRTGSTQNKLSANDSRCTQVLSHNSQRNMFFLGLIILGIGAALPLSEVLAPERYPESVIDERIQGLFASENLKANEKLLLETLLEQDADVSYGRALYPRYFAAEDGRDGWKDNYKLPFSRIEFNLVGSANSLAQIPYSDGEIEFANAQDILMVGCSGSKYFDVVVAVLFQPGSQTVTQIMWRSSNSTEDDECFSDLYLERIDS
jgi:hypothetical protein